MFITIRSFGFLRWWGQVQSDTKIVDKLRWATLGYHHDWDTKIYSQHGEFPPDLADLSNDVISQFPSLVKGKEYKSEAAIVNYYPMDGTLSGHVDHSEPNKYAPLVSISFGQSAIFLIGGHEKSVEPSAILLRHGDILIMSHEARQSFHAVPKILPDQDLSFLSSNRDDFVLRYLSNHRINMNIRQVF